MVNTQLLEEKIKKSGLRVDFLIETLGISHTAYYKKKDNKTPFRAAEVYVLCDLLNIRDDNEKHEIFNT